MYTIDSRTVKPGDVFVALKGEKSDGHDYIPKALAAGAAGVIDGLEALQQAAKDYRATLKAKVIGVTGSAGKTTTKEFLKTFLACYGTEGNFNNHIGLPLTLLNAPKDAAFIVVEMGTNHPGEIAALCDIAAPDIGVICSIGTAHLEFFKTQEGIAREKGTLLKRAREWGMVSESAAKWFPGCDVAKPELLLGEPTANTPYPLARTPALTPSLICPLPGAHNESNMMLAYCVARKLGVTHEACVERLKNFRLPGARWRKSVVKGVTYIDDSYNANPDSMIAALDAFTGNTVVLGDMGELGTDSAALHEKVLRYAYAKGLRVVTVGPQFTAAQFALFQDGDEVLVKGSHSMQLTKFIDERNK